MAKQIQNYVILLTVAVLVKYASAQLAVQSTEEAKAFGRVSVAFSDQKISLAKSMGPIDLALLSVGTCPGTDKNILDMELQSISETQMGLNMRLNFPFSLDSTVSYKIKVDKIEDGQVKEDVFIIAGANFCADLEKYIGFMWDKFSEAMNMSTGCPKPQGDYKLENFPIDMADITIKAFLYGRFKMSLTLLRMGQEVACFYTEFTNSPAGESVK